MTRIVPAGAGDHGREVRAAVLVYQGGVALVTVPDLQQGGNTLMMLMLSLQLKN